MLRKSLAKTIRPTVNANMASVKFFRQTTLVQQQALTRRTVTTSGQRLGLENDEAMADFLQGEIEHEQQDMNTLPNSLQDFRIRAKGTKVVLTKKLGSENVKIEFDINENRNVDEALEEDSEDGAGKIVSYPEFTVSITKPSGKTCLINCQYDNAQELDQGMDEDERPVAEQFNIQHVAVIEEGEDPKGVYESETHNMDPDLYTHLMTMLEERGIDGEFSKELLDYSTDIEHKQYVDFLKDLKKFVDN